MTTTTKTTRKAPAAKATTPAKAPVTTMPKLRWVKTAEANDKGNAPAKAETAEGVYEITGFDVATATWTATGGKAEVLAENVSGKTAWSKCVSHHKARQSADVAA